MARAKYRTMVVAISGGWRDEDIGDSLQEAVYRAYCQALQPFVRWVSIDKLQRNGIYRRAFTVAGLDGRVWVSRSSGMGCLTWKGEIPPATEATEITGRFELPPPDYAI